MSKASEYALATMSTFGPGEMDLSEEGAEAALQSALMVLCGMVLALDGQVSEVPHEEE